MRTWRWLWVFAWLLVAVPSLADERAQVRQAQQRLLHDLAPARVTELLAVMDALDAVAPREVVALLQPVAQKWLTKPATRFTEAGRLLRHVLVTAAERAGDAHAVQQWHDATGVVGGWRWLGPFGHEHGSAFARVSPVETAPPVTPAGTTWPGRSGAVTWQPMPPGLVRADGHVAWDDIVERPDDALIFAEAWFQTSEPTEVVVRVAASGPVRLLLDGVVLGERAPQVESPGLPADLPDLPDAALAHVQLPAGPHRLLVKLGPAAGRMPLRVALTRADGRPLPVMTLPGPAPTLVPGALLPTAETPDRALGNVWPEDADARAEAVVAVGMLGWHGWPMPQALDERLLAAAPLELPADPHLALAHAQLAGEAGDRVDRLRQWLDVLPDDVDVLVATVAALDGMDKSTHAQRLWQQWEARTGRHPDQERARGCVLRSALWSRLDADVAAQQTLSQCARRWPDAPVVVDALIRNAVAGDNLTEAAVLHRRLVALEPGRLERQLALLVALVDADDVVGAQTQAAWLQAQRPDRSRAPEILARLWLGRLEPAKALAAVQQLASHLAQTSTWELTARALLALPGPKDAAVALLRQAIEHAPARTDLRLRLAQLQPDGEFFAPYREDLLALAQRERTQKRTEPVEERLQRTVIQGIGNGQQARYEAVVRYLGPGCSPEQTLDVEYAPTLTRADVLQAAIVRADGRVEPCSGQDVDQFGQDESGMYFDLERITLRFQNLRPGDTIVVEHVTRDLAPTPFGLVFGELVTLADIRPVRQTDVVMLLPAGTQVFAEVVDPRPGAAPLPQMVHQTVQPKAQHDGGAWEEWRLQLGPLAAVASQPNMPGWTDVSPYVHASTFADWRALALWWRGLAAEAIPAKGADPVIHAEALRLTQGLETDEQKVRALYQFATTQVRYVGLEFGIHSLKPHAVRDVIHRGFGDCKDKATLLVALLAEVGIDAQVALTRTMDNGGLHGHVASLGVFNHAIAYVPSLGWWLDATATHHGPHELPGGDASGLALRVARTGDLAGAAPEPLPEGKAEDHLQTSKLDVRLHADASVALDMHFALAGLPAAETRGQLWVPTTRREQLEQFLATRFPGISVHGVDVTGMDPLEDQLRVHMTADVPNWLRASGDGGLSVQPLKPSQSYLQMYGVTLDRTQPLVLGHAVALDNTVWLVPPPRFGVARVPTPVQLTATTQDGRPLGTFTLHAEIAADGALTLRTVFRLWVRQVALVDVAALHKFLSAVDTALRLDVPFAPLAGTP